jgi:uncharacterized SAM-dependent methyltransferase
LRKTPLLLNVLEVRGAPTNYYALDISRGPLESSVLDLSSRFQYRAVSTAGLFGDYEDALSFGASLAHSVPVVYLWLGSSIGNFTREAAGELLRRFCDDGMKTGDRFIIGIDKRNEVKAIQAAYNDKEGVTREFILNGLRAINELAGEEVFKVGNFEYYASYNVAQGRHEAYYRSKCAHSVSILHNDQRCEISLEEGELIHVENAHKYTEEDRRRLEETAQLMCMQTWEDSQKRFTLNVYEKPSTLGA